MGDLTLSGGAVLAIGGILSVMAGAITILYREGVASRNQRHEDCLQQVKSITEDRDFYRERWVDADSRETTATRIASGSVRELARRDGRR